VFLKRYDHRYVHIVDVLLKRIPVAAIPLAIRLNTGPNASYRQHSRWKEMMALLKDATRIPTDSKSEEALLWRMEIWDGRYPEVEDFDLIMSRTPRLEAIIHSTERYFSRFHSYPKRIRFISAPGTLLSYGMHPQDDLDFDQLTSLRLVLSRSEFRSVCWNLPSLRHLTIEQLADRSSTLAIVRLLEKIGKGLLTFYFVESFPREEHLPDAIWEKVPMVQRFEIPCWGKLYPPPEHPMRYARISMHPLHITLGQRLPEQDTLALWLPMRVPPLNGHGEDQTWMSRRPQLEVQMDETWLEVLTISDTSYDGLAVQIAEFYSATETRFTDSEGISLDEYIIFLIKWYWKGGRARHRLRLHTRYDYGDEY